MSEANPPANPEEQPSISLVPEEAASGEGGTDAMAIAKETEGRLRKVSSAYKQLQGEMQAMRERHLRTREQDQRVMKAQVVKSLFEPLQNLRRSVEAMEKAGVDSDVLSGIQFPVLGRTFDQLDPLTVPLLTIGEPSDSPRLDDSSIRRNQRGVGACGVALPYPHLPISPPGPGVYL